MKIIMAGKKIEDDKVYKADYSYFIINFFTRESRFFISEGKEFYQGIDLNKMPYPELNQCEDINNLTIKIL